MSGSEIPRTGLVTVCSVCGELITTVEWTTSNGEPTWEWRHGANIDHEPVPAPADLSEAIRRCDFCSAPDPVWVIPTAKLFTIVMAMGEDRIQAMDDGYWSACPPCKHHVVKRDVDRLVHRAMITVRGAFPKDDPEFFRSAKTELRNYFNGFLLAEPGQPERIAR